MKKNKYLLITIVVLSALFLGACNLPTGEGDADADATTIASTSAAVFTHAAETAVGAVIPSATTQPGSTALPIATNTLIPTLPPASTATTKPIPCNRGGFVKDVTIPDGKEIPAGDAFTKTWRIKNNGSCTWGANYVVLFDSGEQMGAPASFPLGGTVAPGATIDISVNLTAPASAGNYQGNFKLRSHDNIVFGINADAQGPFWVKIVVANPTATAENPTLPPPPRPIYSSGNLDVASSFYGNLDNGSDDFMHHGIAPGDHELTSENGAIFLNMGFTAPTYDQCSTAALTANPIKLENALINQHLCYKTDQGRFGYFKITAYDESSLSVNYLTWE